MRKYILYIVLMVIILAGIILTQSSNTIAINWNPTFTKSDKIPFGTKIFYDLVTEKYGANSVSAINESFYYFWRKCNDTNANQFIITDKFNPGRTETDAMLQFVANGNTLFLASETFEDFFSDTFKIKTASAFDPETTGENQYYNLINKGLKSETPYYFRKILVSRYFSRLDSDNITVLGTTLEGKANFIKIRWGNGYIYLNSIPYSLTNAAILTANNMEYAEKCLSYLPGVPGKNIYWNEYDSGSGKKQSLLSFIESQPPLNAAYYIVIFSLLLYVLFESKRRQKMIPIIEPLRNTTVEFAETIGRLYFQSANHKNIAEKKILHFYEFLRTRLFITEIKPVDSLYQRIFSKTGIPVDKIRQLFNTIAEVKSSFKISEIELQTLNDQIDEFYKLL